MTAPIDRALAKARVERRPYGSADVERAEQRIKARIARRMWDGALSFDDQMQPARDAAVRAAERDSLPQRSFHRLLRVLCETVLGRDLHKLHTFLAQRLPEPEGALVLGCVLRLANREDSARFWWQFAAGAGDVAAACCLYLHHMALGEGREADLWHCQAGLEEHVRISTEHADGRDLLAGLRLLDVLRGDDPRFSPAATAVLAYVPAAIGFVDDMELPLPDPDFTDRIEELTAVL
ncbi:hypothetical protein DVA86_26715 [Streptomyces armeniacus]|uniref:Uncharacterized protein n=1 Tax=Streptomyces armeniacus TaxID=83291 RepID=A0A345XVM7_9ACTN|nr:hypothetical protein [Streptomyces armeniacus]AXK35693.1 hypothetical protein DVA86_26715 [Streptomyces armeniacus]